MEWVVLDEFPGYSVGYDGRVVNNETGRIMTPSLNQNGVAQVGLTKDCVQYRRSLTLLVASIFLDPPSQPAFTTAIHLDGNRLNAHTENLMWRPRWFAAKYHAQFHNDKRGFDRPIYEKNTGEVFLNSWGAATKYGILDREIMMATHNRTYVWPTYQEFRLLD